MGCSGPFRRRNLDIHQPVIVCFHAGSSDMRTSCHWCYINTTWTITNYGNEDGGEAKLNDMHISREARPHALWTSRKYRGDVGPKLGAFIGVFRVTRVLFQQKLCFCFWPTASLLGAVFVFMVVSKLWALQERRYVFEPARNQTGMIVSMTQCSRWYINSLVNEWDYWIWLLGTG